ncbi:MAG: 50S ribosomal protein L10 [Candidatus Hadarchaeales archaeon]
MISASKRIPQWKKDLVEDLARLMISHRVIGIADISNLPSELFQQIRQIFRGKAKLIVAKNTLVKLALDRASEVKPEIRKLRDHVRGQTCLILSDQNPFEINAILRRNIRKAPAKPGSIAATDIIIPAGETDLPPGPVVGELQRVGIKARIQAGRVVITEDCKLLKAGDVITKEISDALAKFGILPVELGLKIRVAFEDGLIYTPEILEIDEEKVSKMVKDAVAAGVCLSLNSGYPTATTIGIMIAEAHAKAIELAVACRFPADEVLPKLLCIAHAEMLAVARRVGETEPAAIDEDLRKLIGSVEQMKPVEEKPKKEEVEEKPKEEKEEELSGLSALFG